MEHVGHNGAGEVHDRIESVEVEVASMRTRLDRQDIRIATVDASYDQIQGDVREIKRVLGHPPRRDRDGEEIAATGMVKAIADLTDAITSRGSSSPRKDDDDEDPSWGDITRTQMRLSPSKLAKRAKEAEMLLAKAQLRVKVVCAIAGVIVALAGVAAVALNVWLKAHGH